MNDNDIENDLDAETLAIWRDLSPEARVNMLTLSRMSERDPLRFNTLIARIERAFREARTERGKP